MKITRFFGLSSKSAIQQAKNHLGENAVIFSHREINEGVEVLATEGEHQAEAVTPSHSSSSTSGNEQVKIRLHAHLVSLGLGEELAGELAYETESINFSTPQTAIRDAHNELANRLPIHNQPVIAAGKTIAVLGSESSGKTSTLVKLAKQASERKDIAALNFLTPNKLSAAESVSLFQDLRHPETVISSEIEPFDLARKRFEATQPTLTLVDTQALTQKDLRNPQNLLTASMRSGVDNYLLLPATLSSGALDKIVSSLSSSIKLKGCIISMVDQAESLGAVISTAIKFQLPIALWSDGENTDSHLYQAQPKHLIEKTINVQRLTELKTPPNLSATMQIM